MCELRKIKYKGVYHLYNYAFQTDCEIKIPLNGKHLTTQSVVQELSEITCPKCLKTLTLKQVADDLGIHESTVSRAINGKYMQTPRGIFEIKYFFSSGVSNSQGQGVSSNSIKSMIKEIIDSEDPKAPYSDQDMVKILSERGIEISRRTVAKYREGLNILSSSKRRRY